MPQSPHRLRNDLKCVEWAVKPYYIHTVLSYELWGDIALQLHAAALAVLFTHA